MIILTKIKQFIQYIWGKRSELGAMDEKDILLSKVVMDIHRTRSHKHTINIGLFAIHPVHPINRPNALADTQQRIDTLEEVKSQLCAAKHLSLELLQTYLPSVSGIKVVRQDPDQFISFEGNGRLAALHTVFSKEDHISIAVEEYIFSDPTHILKQMNRLRNKHQLH